MSQHAVDQHTARWPDPKLAREWRTQQIVSEVSAAIAEGRMSVKEPKFTAHGKQERGRPADKSLRYVWTPDRRRVYLVDRRDGRVFVVTAIQGDGDTTATRA